MIQLFLVKKLLNYGIQIRILLNRIIRACINENQRQPNASHIEPLRCEIHIAVVGVSCYEILIPFILRKLFDSE